MTIITSPQELFGSDLYVDLRPLLGRRLYVKCEGLNFGGSIKMKAAASMVAAAERAALITEDTTLIESSSGNLGVALSAIAASKGLHFTCVTDRRCNQLTAATMRALGTTVLRVDEPHPEGGFLGARLDLVRRLCTEDSRYVWLDQYSNEENWKAHYETTAPEILKRFPDVDVVFVGVGTSGTAMGCVRYFRDAGSSARVVAVDAVGSVSFGAPAAPRHIPGLGAGVRPPMLESGLFDDVVHVPENDAVRMCRTLSARGMLFGGSTGTVVGGARTWLDRHDADRSLQSICISPDMGERYLETVYDDDWVVDHFGPQALQPIL
ncbi:2,3-diaminopropionate biosynthesis protein SbnA [Streptomyces uncialis]|uniref:Cysteine synthase n=1 Tax=Streptomyces uncialis TaxID=1048205 RepID=A0A1Q4V331_9ACTN|nr:2,3-diaminopropionate biosynthesis protein SbnA [Streptomyces uncialis]MCX4657952.1 2,3-diaminopropionate biosynthesis protein SbnA [Streptomyces uncialis]OKH92139.1 cysteine synthase [Streptomyces uncialis]